MKRGKKATELDIVADVQERTRQAAALAAIDGQARLADPRLNPETRGHADELRTEQLTRALDAEHARLLRRHRVADRRAAEAEETLQAIALARQAASPARSVLALHRGKRLYLRLSLAASLTLSAGSAMGVEAAARALNAPTGSGYIAEVGLTGLSTAVILYRAHLAEHRGVLAKGSWQSRVLWTLMTVPLLVSVTANLATLNAVGAFCAISAVAFSVLAYTVADRSSAAMQDRVAEVDAADEAKIRAAAMGEDWFAPVTEEDEEQDDVDGGGQEHAEDAAEDDAARVAVAELEAWLQDRAGRPEDGEDGDGGGTRPVRPVPGSGGGGGAARELPVKTERGTEHGAVAGDGGGALTSSRRSGAAAHIETGGGAAHIERQGRSHRQDQRPGGPGRVLAAAEARRAIGASTQHQIARYAAEHPEASTAQIAAALGLSPATVRRHRNRQGGERR